MTSVTRQTEDVARSASSDGFRSSSQLDPVCQDLREDRAEAGVERAVEDRAQHHREDHRPPSSHGPIGKPAPRPRHTCSGPLSQKSQRGRSVLTGTSCLADAEAYVNTC